jgi:hypothetical protein
LEKVWGYNQVIFQYNDFAVSVDLGGHTIDDVSCQSPVFASFDEGCLLESLDGSDIVTDFVYRFLLGAILGSISIDEKIAFGSQRVFQETLDASAGMLGAIVNE